MPPLKKADQQAKLSGRQPKAFGQKTRRVALMLQGRLGERPFER